MTMSKGKNKLSDKNLQHHVSCVITRFSKECVVTPKVLVKVSSGFTGRPCQDNPKFNREGLHSLLPQFFQGSLEKGAKESLVSSSIERALLGKSTCVCSVHQGVPRTMRAKFIADILHKFTEVLIKGFLKRSFIYLRNTERAPICC